MIPSNKVIFPPSELILGSSNHFVMLDPWTLIKIMLNYKFGTQQGKNDLEELRNHIIKVQMLLFWYMTSQTQNPLRIYKNFG